MSNEHIVCPACGLEVPDGRFCKFCGKPLHPKGDYEPESLIESTPHESDEMAENTSRHEIAPRFDFSIEGMSPSEQAILFSKAELAVLAKELDILIQQIRATRQALHLENAEKAKIAVRAEFLRKVLEKTKSRRKELLDVQGTLEIESQLIALDEKQSKLAMLEDVAGSIEKEVYDEKRNELKESIKRLKSQLKKQKKIARDWIKTIEKQMKQHHKEINRLTAQYKIGDISIGRFEKSKTSMTRSLTILDGGYQILNDLIEQSETLLKK